MPVESPPTGAQDIYYDALLEQDIVCFETYTYNS